MTGTAEFVSTTHEELFARIAAARERFVALVATVAPELAIDGSWRVQEVLAHLVTVFDRYVAPRPDRLAPTARAVDGINARELDELAGVPMPELVDRLATTVDRLTSWHALPLDLQVPFHGGTTIDVQAALTNAIGELLVHGFDVARAAGRSWPIDDRDGILLLGFGTQILPAYVRTDDAGHDAGPGSARIEADGCPAWRFAIDGSSCTSRPVRPDDGADVADVVVRGRATDLVLAFYGRVPAVSVEARAFFDRFERP